MVVNGHPPRRGRPPGWPRRTRRLGRGRTRRPTGRGCPARRRTDRRDASAVASPISALGVAAHRGGRQQVPRAARGGRQQRGHGRAEPGVGAGVAEQVQPGEHAADDVIARRGGARTGADGRREAPVELTGVESEAGESSPRRAKPAAAIRQATVERGDLRRGDDEAVRGRHAQIDRGRGGVPRAQVDRRRPGELGPAGEDRGQRGPIGRAESTRRQAGGARGHRHERAGRGGEQRGRSSDIDDREGVDVGRSGQRPVATQAARRRLDSGRALVKSRVGRASRAASGSDEMVVGRCPNRPIVQEGAAMGVLHVGELLTLPVLRGARVLAGSPRPRPRGRRGQRDGSARHRGLRPSRRGAADHPLPVARRPRRGRRPGPQAARGGALGARGPARPLRRPHPRRGGGRRRRARVPDHRRRHPHRVQRRDLGRCWRSS